MQTGNAQCSRRERIEAERQHAKAWSYAAVGAGYKGRVIEPEIARSSTFMLMPLAHGPRADSAKHQMLGGYRPHGHPTQSAGRTEEASFL